MWETGRGDGARFYLKNIEKVSDPRVVFGKFVLFQKYWKSSSFLYWTRTVRCIFRTYRVWIALLNWHSRFWRVRILETKPDKWVAYSKLNKESRKLLIFGANNESNDYYLDLGANFLDLGAIFRNLERFSGTSSRFSGSWNDFLDLVTIFWIL